MAQVVPSFNENHLERICMVLADADSGLLGSEIGRILKQLEIQDHDPVATKWKRLCSALSSRQRQDGCGNNVVRFIYAAMDPVRYTSQPELFEQRRTGMNEILFFAGYSLETNGKLRRRPTAQTLEQAQERASRMRTELEGRNVHPDVLQCCRAELVQKNNLAVVFEATKGIADKIRSRTGLTEDGAELLDHAFGFDNIGLPFLAFNSLLTNTERNEQTGLMNVIKGMFGALRNVTADAPKVSWNVTDRDALDLLTIASMIHKRIDAAIRTPRMI